MLGKIPAARLALIEKIVAQARRKLPASRRKLAAGFLRGYRGRVLVLRAGRDRVVPPGNTDRLLAALPVQADVVDFPDRGHDDLSEDPRYGEALAAFMR